MQSWFGFERKNPCYSVRNNQLPFGILDHCSVLAPVVSVACSEM